jgi:penicillin-binding protein 2
VSAVRTFPAPHGANAAHLLGHVDRASADDVARGNGAVTADETVGRAGLEAQYDKVLRGTHGTATVSIDPRGGVTGEVSATAPAPGRDVVTNIPGPVQASAERALSEAVAGARRAGYAADSGAAVVLDVRTGAVVAAASHPAYDPSLWTGGISQADLDALMNPAAATPLVSRVTGAVMPPASTFKVVSLPAAAAMGVDLGGTYDCTSAVQVGNRAFNNYESKAFGPLTLKRNLEVSCDTIWYRFAYDSWLAQGGLSARDDSGDPFVAMANAYGLGRKTGVDLPGEVTGRVPDRAWKRSTWEQTKEATCQRATGGYPEVAATDPARADYLKALAVENCASGGTGAAAFAGWPQASYPHPGMPWWSWSLRPARWRGGSAGGPGDLGDPPQPRLTRRCHSVQQRSTQQAASVGRPSSDGSLPGHAAAAHWGRPHTGASGPSSRVRGACGSARRTPARRCRPAAPSGSRSPSPGSDRRRGPR